MAAPLRGPLVILIALVLLAARRSDALLNAQFWAEDGVVFYRQAMLDPGPSLWIEPVAGYLMLISRIVGSIAAATPAGSAPLVSNLLALLVQASCAALIVSKRFAHVIPSQAARFAAAIALIALPTVDEVHGSITNVQWYLVIAITLVSISAPPRNLRGLLLDTFALLVSGLSTILIVIALPLFALRVVRYRDLYSWAMALVALAGATAQTEAFLRSTRSGTMASAATGLPAGPIDIVQMVIYRVVGGAFLGNYQLINLRDLTGTFTPVLWICIPLIILTAFASAHVDARLRWPLLYVAVVPAFFSALHPGAYAALWIAPLAGRYYVPGVAAIVLLMIVAFTAARRTRTIIGVGLALIIVATASDFRIPPRQNFGWQQQSACVGSGQPCSIKIPPGWTLELR